MKQAKEEAQAEIDGYRKQREDQYQKYEKSVSFHLRIECIFFEVSLGYESVDQSTFSMKCWKCSSINAFIPPMKLQKNAFNS